MPLNEDSDIGAKIWLRRLRSRTAKAGKTSLQKVNLRFFNLHRDYSRELTYIVGCMRTFLELNSYEPYSSSRKKKCDAHAKLFRLFIKPIGFLKFSFRIVYGTKIFKPKIIGGYPTENIFPEIVNPREHSTLTGDEGKKPSDKKNHTTENSQKI